MDLARKPKIAFCIILCLFLFSSFLQGQIYRFKDFGPGKIPDPYIYTLNQDKNGFLWIGTGSGLVKFDGFSFYNIVFPDSSKNRYASVSLKDRSGNLWFGCNDGALFYTKDNKLYQVPDLNIQSINALFEDSEGFIWIIPQDRMILKISENNTNEIVRYHISPDILMSSASLVPGGAKIFIGTQQNLLYCSLTKDTVIVETVIKGIDYSNVRSIKPLGEGGTWLVGVEGNGIYRLRIINNIPVVSRFQGHPELESADIKSISSDKSGAVWISTSGSGLFELRFSMDWSNIESENIYTKSSGLVGETTNTVFQDMEGNIWIGYFGEGLSMLTSQALNFTVPSTNPENNNIMYINQLGGKYLLGTSKGYYLFDIRSGKSDSFNDLSYPTGNNEILSFLLDKNNILWIGTKGGGVYRKNLAGGTTIFYRSGRYSEDFVKHIASDGKNLWLSTVDGVIIVDIKSAAVVKKYRNENHLPHNSINQIYFRRDGSALVATDCDRLYDIRPDSGVTIGTGILYGNTRNRITCFTEDQNGGVWAGTSGNGVFYVRHDSVTRITSENGLLSNYCRSIIVDSDNMLWIGHERGFSRYDTNTGVIKSFSNEFARGGDCNPFSLFETSDGRVLIGTTEGLICYERAKDKKEDFAPINNILSVTINDNKLPYQSIYSLAYNKRYRILIDYVGINMNDPERVSYRTKMENIDDDWSEIKYSRQISYNPSEGKYKFSLMSISEDGFTQETPASFEIIIKMPFWRTWWFYLAMIVVVSGLVVLIIHFREKAQREMKEYLEHELAERTRLVLQQKDEIQLQNVEITDSINYAKRIQSSILPDIGKLKESFRDAFIIFHPRDIVSGDFYWFDKIDEEHFVIVCADSTGHGVPGAFMSMIGSTLLQDIVSRKKITKPSEVLTLLDRQIFSTLNQNVDLGVSNDGMDMVVCEINVKSRHIRFASAMRPVIVVLAGESYYIRGNRCSVGGESVIEKYFDDQEYYLAKGDTVYMFSDGLPDQFGGADGKKLKIARLKKLIEEVSPLEMSEQKDIISKFYFDWKGDYEQVDDILLMGVKV